MKCWKGSLWCQEFQDIYGIHFHDIITIFLHFSSLRRAVERHTVKTKSGAPGLAHSQICLTMHALGKANVKIKDRFLGKKPTDFDGASWPWTSLSHGYHMLSPLELAMHCEVWGFYYRMLKLMMKNAEIWTEFDMAWLLDSTWLSMTQWSKVYIIRSSQSQMCFDVFLCGSRLKWRL